MILATPCPTSYTNIPGRIHVVLFVTIKSLIFTPSDQYLLIGIIANTTGNDVHIELAFKATLSENR
nr:MAG TPA: hypothetical protein [Caudoviricetes sp.]